MKCSLTKKGNNYYVTYNKKMPDGKYKKIWITLGETKMSEANKKLTDIQSKIYKGIFVAPDNMTVKEFLEYWLETIIKPAKEITTYDGYKSIINVHLIPQLGHLKLQKLNIMTVQDYFNKLKIEGRCDGKGGLSANTIHKHYALLNKALKYALKNEIIYRNIMEAIEIPKKESSDVSQSYNEEQMKTLLSKVKDTRLEIPVFLGLILGLRRSEICGLQWQNVDLIKGTIHIKNTRVHTSNGFETKPRTKNKSSNRKLKIGTTLLTLLKNERKKQMEYKLLYGEKYISNDFVFKNQDGELIDPGTLTHLFSNFLAKNDLSKIRLHDLRHTFATIMLKRGIDHKTVQQMLGHSNIYTLFNIYGHVLAEMEDEAVGVLEDILQS
ncbi:MAG: site-specific integrase [Clostridia bacterium]|nr:site-specific integrase [Clostridia bacterium]